MTKIDPSTWSQLSEPNAHGGRLSAMIQVAKAAGDHTLTYFRSKDLVIDAKSDDSPVTIADREAEKLVREMISERFGSDTMQGEEFPDTEGETAYRWVVDPIDGTKSFICGVPLYSTLLALEKDGEPLGGVIYLPGLGEMVVAVIGMGCWYCSTAGESAAAESLSDQASLWQECRVSDRDSLSDAVFVTSQVDSFGARGADAAYRSLESECRITRSWGDGYGYLLVATGRADLMIDPECNAWDVAAILPVITESGGEFTSWKGEKTVRGGDGVGTNGRLHEAVLAKLQGESASL